MKAFVFALAVLVAGCTTDVADPEDSVPAGPTPPMLSGYVVDQAIRPIENVQLEVQGENATTTTTSDGYYQFRDLPYDEPMVITASLEGYETVSQSVTIPTEEHVQLNYTLAAVPLAVPRMAVLEFQGFLPCQAAYNTGGDGQHIECGALSERADIWEFSVESDFAGAVIEVVWEAGSAASELLNITVETVGFGDQDAILAQTEGPTILRAQISESAADKFYRPGGIVRVTVAVGTDNDEEAGASAGAAVNQDFEVFASLFYHEPPPATYTIADA